MKQVFLAIGALFFLLTSCDESEKVTGTVVFGANYHVVDCISYVDVYLDGKHLGQLEAPADSVPNCDVNYGLREELEIGKHTYKVEIRPPMGTGCVADIVGELSITEGVCETIFIDYFNIEWN